MPYDLSLLGTHFALEDGNFRGFTIENCDVCGCKCSVPTVIIHEWRAKLLKLGMKEMKEIPPEIGVCEALGGVAVCPNCYKDE